MTAEVSTLPGARFSAAAQAYARMGIAVFPLREREKKPLAFSTGLSAASANDSLAAQRWAGEADIPIREPKFEGERLPKRIRANRACNVACATGEISGFWVLDLDGPEAEEDLASLVAVHGELPETVEQGTGKGRHLCFVWDPAFDVKNSAGKIGRGIDVRGNGGYIVLPPSIHPGDAAKGIPPGRIYAWTAGKSPRERAFAPAPHWLLQLVCPPAPAASTTPAKPREFRASGGTTRFGAATLRTACRTVAQAQPGQQQSALFGYAAFIGAYVAGGEIEHAQARNELIAAGLQMTAAKGAWTRKEVESAVVRGMEKGAAHPKSAPAPETFRSAGQREPSKPAETAAHAAGEIQGARRLWDGAQSADCRAVRSWFTHHGLDPDGLPRGLAMMRAHAAAPIGVGDYGEELTGPAILIPMIATLDDLNWNQAPDALAILPLEGSRIVQFVGPARGRVGWLSPLPEDGSILIGIDFLDVWTLAASAQESGHDLAAIVAPSLRTFAGEALGDRWGRIDARAPHANPANPPWTLEGERPVFLAVRGDLRSPEFKGRQTFGGSERFRLQGEAAARFFGGLADQAWRRAGANPVRILKPSTGAGFSEGRPA